MSELIEREISSAICGLVAMIPPHDANKRQRADYQIRKAEVLDLVAAVRPAWAAQATAISARARHEARAIAVDY